MSRFYVVYFGDTPLHILVHTLIRRLGRQIDGNTFFIFTIRETFYVPLIKDKVVQGKGPLVSTS